MELREKIERVTYSMNHQLIRVFPIEELKIEFIDQDNMAHIIRNGEDYYIKFNEKCFTDRKRKNALDKIIKMIDPKGC
jgi:predicted RNA-binding protein YlxR (DUF448 family)